MSNYMVHHIKKMLYMYSEKLGAGTIMVFATLLLFANSGFSQEVSGSTQNGTPQAPVTSNDTVAAADRTTPAKSQSSKSNLSSFTKTVETAGFPRMSQASDPDNWQFEIRPYIWLAGLYGTLRVNNTTAQVGQDSASVLGMLDFAAAAQVEAI